MVDLDPGFAVGAIDALSDQTIECVWSQPSGSRRWAQRLPFGDLDPVTAAEIIGAPEDVTR